VLVDRPSAVIALRAVHKAFDLDQPTRDEAMPFAPRRLAVAPARPALDSAGSVA